ASAAALAGTRILYTAACLPKTLATAGLSRSGTVRQRLLALRVVPAGNLRIVVPHIAALGRIVLPVHVGPVHVEPLL
ncbi:hypothetical protein J8J32_22900, partial [Mycobacterium tuberculosis]|nr:hypothetical protein [Mycobacterium tuberculosis]